MCKTVLINCPPWGVVMPPLGIAYLVTYLKSKGKTIEVLDLNLSLYQKATIKQKVFWQLDTINKMSPIEIAYNIYDTFKLEIQSFIEQLEPFSLIGFSANNLISTTFGGIIAGLIKIKFPHKIIIMGGPGCFHSWDRKAVPKDAVDFFVIGEGEEVLNEFIDQLSRTKQGLLSEINIPGLLHYNTKKIKQFYPPVAIKNLDLLPFPSFQEFDLNQYNCGEEYKPLPMLMSRGCINRCSYCIDWYMCSNFRVRKPENIVAEIESHVKNYHITHVEFNDLLCNGNLMHLEKFCDLLIRSNIDVRWISYAAIRKNMTEKLLQKIKASGCNSLCYGIESGSDAVLKRMHKHYNSADAAELIKKTAAAGIEVRMNIIVGFPGETENDFMQTLEFVRKNREYITQVTNVSSFVLMPGSDLSVYPQEFGIDYLDETDPGSWKDELGLTQDIRNQRVRRTCQLLEDLRIKSLIVNYQKSPKPLEKNELTLDRVKKETKVSIGDKDYFVKKNMPKSFPQKTVLFLLFFFSRAIDFYLLIIKKVRGSIIFPGN